MEAARTLASGERPRIAVGRIIDKSRDQNSLAYQLKLLGLEDTVSPADVTAGIRDLLTTALFDSDRFIVLERELLDEILTELAFAGSGPTPLPQGQLEGAELLLLGAVTAFNAGQSGGVAFPIPVPLNDQGDFGIIDVELRRSYVAMDLRLLDVRTGRVVFSVAVEGTAHKFGAGLAGILSLEHGHIPLPVLLGAFANTPVEAAIGKMVDRAVETLVVGMDGKPLDDIPAEAPLPTLP
jgi:curli biogenesis system outer membrane secretion channel CsgG